MAQRRPVAASQLARDDAVAGQQEIRARLVALLGRQRLVLGERAPAPDRRQMRQDAPRLTAARAAPGRCALAAAARDGAGGHDGAERVGRREARPEQLPQRGQGLGRIEARRPGEITRERGAAQLQVEQDVLGPGLQRGTLGALAQPADVVAQRHPDAAATRAVAGGRLEHRPHDLAAPGRDDRATRGDSPRRARTGGRAPTHAAGRRRPAAARARPARRAGRRDGARDAGGDVAAGTPRTARPSPPAAAGGAREPAGAGSRPARPRARTARHPERSSR